MKKNWLKDLCTAEEYCVRCDTSYPGGHLHSCGQPSRKVVPSKMPGFVKILDAANGSVTWQKIPTSSLKPGETYDRPARYDGEEPLEFIRFDVEAKKNVFKKRPKVSKSARRKKRQKAADYFAAQEFGVEL